MEPQTTNKNPWKSWTLWLNGLLGAFWAVVLFVPDVASMAAIPAVQKQLPPHWLAWIALAQAVATYLIRRYKTGQPIGPVDKRGL